MFEDELGSNPAHTNEAKAKATPRMLNLASIFKKHVDTKLGKKLKKELILRWVMMRCRFRRVYHAQFIQPNLKNPTATKLVTSEGDISFRVMRQVT